MPRPVGRQVIEALFFAVPPSKVVGEMIQNHLDSELSKQYQPQARNDKDTPSHTPRL